MFPQSVAPYPIMLSTVSHCIVLWCYVFLCCRVHTAVSVKCCTAVSALSLMLMAGNSPKSPARSQKHTVATQKAEGDAATAVSDSVHAASNDSSRSAAEQSASNPAENDEASAAAGLHASGTSSSVLAIDEWISFNLHPQVWETALELSV